MAFHSDLIYFVVRTLYFIPFTRIDWLNKWMIDRSIDQSIDRFIYLFIDQSIVWLVDRSIDWFIDRLVGLLIDWLIGTCVASIQFLVMSSPYGAWRTHSFDTPHIQQDSSGRVISPTHRPPPDNTQHSQQTTHPCPRRDSNPQSL
jgi:hypothetical protein